MTETTPDHRPVNCRFRLQDEGKPYPRSSCAACGKGITTGLGKQCAATTPTKPAAQGTVALLPCPFCGSEARHEERHNPMSRWKHSIDCRSSSCGMSGPVASSKAEAARLWNDRALAAEAALAKAVVFDVGNGATVESRGDGAWAVKDGGCVLNADGTWEWEPSPSNRTDEFIARTRFDRDDALRRAAAIRAQGE